MRKVFVTVLAEHDTIGRCKPLSITWEDGRIYEIDAYWTCVKRRRSNTPHRKIGYYKRREYYITHMEIH